MNDNNIAWTHDYIMINLDDEIDAVKQDYGVNSFKDIPISLLKLPRLACIGDLTQLTPTRVGIVIDIQEYSWGVIEVTIVTDKFKVFKKQYLALWYDQR